MQSADSFTSGTPPPVSFRLVQERSTCGTISKFWKHTAHQVNFSPDTQPLSNGCSGLRVSLCLSKDLSLVCIKLTYSYWCGETLEAFVVFRSLHKSAATTDPEGTKENR